MRNSFIELFGNFVSSRGMVTIVREDTRSPADNEKLAVKQLQSMLDKSEEIASREKDEVVYNTEKDRIQAGKTERQVSRYNDRRIGEKKRNSLNKQNRKFFD